MSKQSNALEVLRKDHRDLQALFQRFERGGGGKEHEQLRQNMIRALRLHTAIEEQVFYPYVREATDQLELVEEASVEHLAAKDLAEELERGNSDPVHQRAVVKVLAEYLGHHIREEEERIFPAVEKTGVDLEALGEELLERRRALESGRGGSGASGGREQSGQSTTQAQGSTMEDDGAFLEKHREDLSRSTLRAKWIHSPDEHEDYHGQTLATRNPDVIRQWAEKRKAMPATVQGNDPENPRVLRLDFPDYSKNLVHMSWDAWLRTFKERNLVFKFQEHLKNGHLSNFFQLDSPDREEG